jgi:dipeptidyl aminopeptidase/acylaminoacyl peptidase
MDWDGQHPTRLTETPMLDEFAPNWSLDGRHIVYQDNAYGGIYVMDVETQSAVEISHDIPGHLSSPSWSPDGRKIAVTSTTTGSFWDIWVMDADGSNATNLTRSETRSENFPSWSPDGKKIVYSSEERDFVKDIHVMNADGTGDLNLTNDPADDTYPTWSPDGSLIAFVSDRARGLPLADLFVMDPNGGDIRQVTQSVWDVASPEWSPDSKSIVYAERRIDFDLFSVSLPLGETSRLTGSLAQDISASWQAIPEANPGERRAGLTVTPSRGVAGTMVTLHGRDCGEPGETVAIRFEGAPADVWGEQHPGEVTIDAQREFRVTYPIPEAMKWWMRPLDALLAGEYHFVVDPTGCEAQFTVEADSNWTDPNVYNPAPYIPQGSAGEMPVGGGPPGEGGGPAVITLGAGVVLLSLALFGAAFRRQSQC